MKEPLRLAIVKLGLRAQNFPNEMEKLVLYEHLKENFGGNHLSEIYLAFKMAIAGSLTEINTDGKEVPLDANCYENFSCLYVSKILTAYRNWSAQEYRELEPVISKPEDDLKFLQGPRQEVHTGFYIDQAYSHFLSFKDEQWQKFPTMFYDQLELDGLVEKEFWRKLMAGVRKFALKDLIHEKLRLSNGKNYLSGERSKAAESIRATNLKEVEKKISEYETGKRDGELEVMAKQRSVIKLFEIYKEKGREHVYEPAD